MSSRRDLLMMCLFGLLVAFFAAWGIGVRATYGAQTTADEPQYLLSALSLWEDGDLDISDQLRDGRYREFHEVELPTQTQVLEDGRRISPHDPLLPVLLAVPMGLGGWVGAKASLAILGGALAALTVWAAQHCLGVSRRTAYITGSLFALAPPLFIYSTQVYPEIPAALAVLAGFAAVVGPFQLRGRLVFAIAVIALPWLAVKYLPLAAVLAVAGLIKAGKGRRSTLVLTFAVAAAVYLVGHLAIYGGLTAYATGDHFVGGEFTAVGSQVDLWGRSARLIGLLVDRGFGIAAWQPAFLLLPLVAGWALARRGEGFAVAGWLAGTGWLVATFVAFTMHGWWFPGRQLVVVLPLAVLLIGAWVDGARSRRTSLLVLLGLPGVIASWFLVVEGLQGRLTWVVDFGATSNPLYGALATVMPDYMAPGGFTWALHGAWVSVALALGWLGWRIGTLRREETREPESKRDRKQEGVLT
ncbi:MAG: hypothetical protein ACRDZM_01995 [Acidimicrobiia bacterium]